MAAQSKAHVLTEVHALLKKRYKLGPRPERMTVLEAVIYGICHEGTTREQANQVLSRFKDDFFDWNEVRVSSLEEIEGVLAGLPDPEDRAFRIRRFLRQLFEKTYSFALESLTKKPLKDAVKVLQEYEALQSDYVVATVIQQALGGHAIPIDVPIRRGLERLHITEAQTDNAALRSALERAVPKNRGSEFVDLMEELTHDTCVEGKPDCPHCELKKPCPTGQTRLADLKAAEKSSTRAGAKASKAAASAARDGAARSKAAAKPSARPAAKPKTKTSAARTTTKGKAAPKGKPKRSK
jgi:endonuclease-3